MIKLFNASIMAGSAFNGCVYRWFVTVLCNPGMMEFMFICLACSCMQIDAVMKFVLSVVEPHDLASFFRLVC